MVILVDKEGKQIVLALIDTALKAGGLQNLQQINAIVGSVKDLPESKATPTSAEKEPKDNSEQPPADDPAEV